jgi:hypothetical protein
MKRVAADEDGDTPAARRAAKARRELCARGVSDLFDAARRGNLKDVKKLRQQGVSLVSKLEGDTPLHVACMRATKMVNIGQKYMGLGRWGIACEPQYSEKHYDVVAYLLGSEEGTQLLDAPRDIDGATALSIAFAHDHIELVLLLLEHGASPPPVKKKTKKPPPAFNGLMSLPDTDGILTVTERVIEDARSAGGPAAAKRYKDMEAAYKELEVAEAELNSLLQTSATFDERFLPYKPPIELLVTKLERACVIGARLELLETLQEGVSSADAPEESHGARPPIPERLRGRQAQVAKVVRQSLYPRGFHAGFGCTEPKPCPPSELREAILRASTYADWLGLPAEALARASSFLGDMDVLGDAEVDSTPDRSPSWRQPVFSDWCLELCGKTYHVHRVVLSVAATYFRVDFETEVGLRNATNLDTIFADILSYPGLVEAFEWLLDLIYDTPAGHEPQPASAWADLTVQEIILRHRLADQLGYVRIQPKLRALLRGHLSKIRQWSAVDEPTVTGLQALRASMQLSCESISDACGAFLGVPSNDGVAMRDLFICAAAEPRLYIEFAPQLNECVADIETCDKQVLAN